jgi:threonine dehydratase
MQALSPAALAAASTAAVAAATPFPSLDELRATAERLHGHVLHTPVWRWQTGAAQRLQPPTEVWLKLELFQRTGSFKLRGALNAIAQLDDAARRRGVCAASAGNHAMAVAEAARSAGMSPARPPEGAELPLGRPARSAKGAPVGAKLAMPRTASPARVAACRAAGAEVLLFDTIREAFDAARALVDSEGRTMIHPFDGPLTAAGTGTVGLELMDAVPELDAVVVPVGGGGLAGGIAAAVKQLNPRCRVYGVEPEGADAMARSFEQGAPATLERVDTVADSLGAPYALDYSFGVCRRFVDEIVRVSDDALCRALFWLFRDMKLAVEPAGAAATAALFGPLRQRLEGRRVGLIVCGANLDAVGFAKLVTRGAETDAATTD